MTLGVSEVPSRVWDGRGPSDLSTVMGLGVCVVLTGEFRCGGIEEIENERVHIAGVETLSVVWACGGGVF